jgi:hypothetical protein
MPEPTLDLLINIADPGKRGLLLAADSTRTDTASRQLVRNDGEQLRVRLVKPSASPGRLWDYIDPADATVRVAIGSPDGIPTAGAFALSYDGHGTALDQLPFDVSAAALQTPLSAAVTAAADGAVEVARLAPGVYQVEFQTSGPKTLIAANPAGLAPQSIVDVSRVQTGADGVREIQIVRLVRYPYAYAEPATPLPAAAATVTEIQAGDVSLPSVQRVALDPAPYGGTWGAVVGGTAYTFSARATAADIAAALGAGYSVTAVGETSWDIAWADPGAQDPITVDVAGLLVPLGVSGPMALSTYSMFWAFAATAGPTLSATLEVEVEFTGEPRRTVLRVPVTAVRDVIDLANLVPTALPSYYTAAQTDALLDGKAAAEHTHGVADITDLPPIGGSNSGDLVTYAQLESAQNDATAAIAYANTAQSTADSALSTANNALTNANAAQSDIDGHMFGEQAGTHIAAASEAARGSIELATAAEAIAGTDAARAITPAGLAATISDPILRKMSWSTNGLSGTGVGLGYDNGRLRLMGAIYMSAGVEYRFPVPGLSISSSNSIIGMLELVGRGDGGTTAAPYIITTLRGNQSNANIIAPVGAAASSGPYWILLSSAHSFALGDTITGNVTNATAKVWRGSGLPGSVSDVWLYDVTGIFTTADTNVSVNGTPTGKSIAATLWGNTPSQVLFFYVSRDPTTGRITPALFQKNGVNQYVTIELDGAW